MKPSNYTFTVFEKDADFILNTLAKEPFAVVAPLLNELQRQANEQNAAAAAPPQPKLAPASEGAD